jgi:hypothetical protein
MKYYILLTIFFLGLGCQPKNSNNSETVARTTDLICAIDGVKVTGQKIRIEYISNGQLNRINSEQDNISLPKFDSAMTNFKVLWKDYTLEMSGGFLTYELPNLLASDVEKWYLNIDTPPFEHENYSDTLNYVFMIHIDSTRLTGIWYLD